MKQTYELLLHLAPAIRTDTLACAHNASLELGKDFFCDLYLFDTSKHIVKKLWSRAFPDNYFIPTRGLVFDSKKGCIYLLCIDRKTTNASLHRFDVKTGEHAIVSNEIVFQTNCIMSTAYLIRKTMNYMPSSGIAKIIIQKRRLVSIS